MFTSGTRLEPNMWAQWSWLWHDCWCHAGWFKWLTTLNNCADQKSISECKMCWALRWMGCSGHRITKTGLIAEDWENVSWIDESPGWWRCRNGVGNVFLAHFGLISTNHGLHATSCLSVVAEYCCWCIMTTVYLPSHGYFEHVAKQKSSPTGFVSMSVSSVFFGGLPSSTGFRSSDPIGTC